MTRTMTREMPNWMYALEMVLLMVGAVGGAWIGSLIHPWAALVGLVVGWAIVTFGGAVILARNGRP